MRITNFTYVGKTYKNCDPSGAQQAALSSAQSMEHVLNNSYQTVFGLGSSMYKSLKSGYDKIISAAHGMSPEAYTAMKSKTLATTAASEAATERAVNARGASTSAVPGVESGVNQAVRGAAISGLETAKNTQLGNIDVEDEKLRIGERDKAMNAEQTLGEDVFKPAGEFGQLDVAEQKNVEDQANANQQASSSWMGLVGGLADAAVGGLTAGGCVTPETLITLANGATLPAKDLMILDELFGFGHGETLVGIESSIQPCVKVILDNGCIIVVSESHTFAVQSGGYVEAKSAEGIYLRALDDQWLVKKVEPVGNQTVIKLKLSRFHGYLSNGVWSLE